MFNPKTLGLRAVPTLKKSMAVYSLYMSIHQEPKLAEKPLQASILLRISSIC